MKLKRWIFIESGEEGYQFFSGTYPTKKECVAYYKSLCSAKTPVFGRKEEGETVQYVKLTGEMK